MQIRIVKVGLPLGIVKCLSKKLISGNVSIVMSEVSNLRRPGMSLQRIASSMDEFRRYIKGRGWGPVGSVCFHMLLALLLLGFASNRDEYQQMPIDVVIVDPPKPPDVDIKPVDSFLNIDQPVFPEIPSQTKAIQESEQSEMLGDPTIKGGVGDEISGLGVGSGDAGDPEQFQIDFAKSTSIMKNLYSTRTKGGKGPRPGAVKYPDGSPNRGEEAVLRALRWLKDHQEADGSWVGGGSPTAMCGLALLCYMGHGETPVSREFGPTVERAIRYLLYAQEDSGRFKNAGPNYSYGHAIATYALAESYGMTGVLFLKDPMDKAVKIIIEGQQAGGAFDYEYAKNARKDMSVTGWQVQALKAAKMAGCDVQGLQECLYKCVSGVKSFSGPGGGFGYDGVGNRDTLAGAGALALVFLGSGNDPVVTSTFQATRNLTPGWPSAGGGTYNWYYMTQARYQHGGELWKSWDKAMLPMLVNNQMKDGHWESNSTHGACPVYDTTLCCLCLEVYYRYLPTMVRADEVKRAPRTQVEVDAQTAAQIAL